MENKLNINSSYSLVEKKPSFSDRHIGPSEAEVKEMLDKLEGDKWTTEASTR